jgi:hypothetical protein
MSLLHTLLSENTPLEQALLDAGFAPTEGPFGEWLRGPVRYTPGLDHHSLRVDGRQPSRLEPGFSGELGPDGRFVLRSPIDLRSIEQDGPYRAPPLRGPNPGFARSGPPVASTRWPPR